RILFGQFPTLFVSPFLVPVRCGLVIPGQPALMFVAGHLRRPTERGLGQRTEIVPNWAFRFRWFSSVLVSFPAPFQARDALATRPSSGYRIHRAAFDDE